MVEERGQSTAPQESSATVKPQPSGGRSSRLRTLGAAFAALLLYAVLVDAVIETFLSGSRVRWIAVGVGAVYVGLSVLFWRRIAWATKAALSLLVLLGLFAATGWLPDGLTKGIEIARQPTGTVFAAVTIAAIAFSAITLARMRSLPVRIVVVMLAVYGIAAFGIAIAAGTSYADLFHGRSLWNRLPFWLQGAFAGGLVLVPVTLLVHVLYGLLRIRGRQLRGWAVQMLALCMSLVMVVAGFTAPSAGPPSQSVQPPGPSASPSAAPDLQPIPISSDRVRYEQALDRLDRVFAVAEKFQAKIDPADFDVQVKARQLGGDLQRVFEFVRDEIAFESYRGVLRGENGTLISRAANAADKAMLLAALLRAVQMEVRFARGQLDEQTARKLISQMFSGRSPRASEAALQRELEALRVELAAIPDVEGELQRYEGARAAAARDLSDRTAHDATALAEVLTRAGILVGAKRDEEQGRLVEEARDHTWVQVHQAGQWIDLDPSFLESHVGQRFADPNEFPETLPASLEHRITFQVSVEYLASGQLTSQRVLEVHASTAELFGAAIFFGNIPQGIGPAGDLEQTRRFQPFLAINGKVQMGQPFDLIPAGGDFGGLSTALTGSPVRFAAEWLDISLTAPLHTPASFRRAVVDRIGVAARAAGGNLGILPAVDDDARVTYLLLREYQVLIAAGVYNEQFVARQLADFLARNRAWFAGALRLRFGRDLDADSRRALAGQFRYPMAALEFASELSAFLKQANSGGQPSRIYHRGPTIVLFSQGLDRRRGLGSEPEISRYLGFDIVSTGLYLASTEQIAMADRLRWGVYLTNLELALLRAQTGSQASSSVQGTSTVMELASQQRIPLSVLTPASLKRIEDLAISPEAKVHIRRDLEGGYVVVVPERSPELRGQKIAEWWRVSLEDGSVLGISETGEGQGFAEDFLAIARISSVVVCPGFYWYNVKKKVLPGKLHPGYAMAALALCIISMPLGAWGIGLKSVSYVAFSYTLLALAFWLTFTW